MIHVTINGKPVEVSEGSTIMEAAETVGIRIPRMCISTTPAVSVLWKWRE